VFNELNYHERVGKLLSYITDRRESRILENGTRGVYD